MSVCFDSAAVAATLSTSGILPFTLSVAERSRRGSHWIVIIKKPYYGWFTEGFGTKDLQEARALLDELSH